MAAAGMALKAGYPRRQGPDVNPQRKISGGVRRLSCWMPNYSGWQSNIWLSDVNFLKFRVQFLLTTAPLCTPGGAFFCRYISFQALGSMVADPGMV